MTDPTPDTLYARFCRDRDPQVLAELFDRTAPAVLRLARHLAPTGVEAEELVQETFLALLEGTRRYRPRGRFDAWLYAILANKARQAARRRRRAPVAAAEEPAAPEASGGRVLGREVKAAVERALQGIAEPYRRVLDLHLHEQLAPATIAARLARPQGTVRSQLHRGLELLRRGLPRGLAPGVALLPTGGLPGIRELLLARAASFPAVTPLAASFTLIPLLGVVTMKKLLFLSLSLVVLAGAALLYVDPWAGLEPGPEIPPPDAPKVATAPAEPEEPARVARLAQNPSGRMEGIQVSGRTLSPGRIPDEETLVVEVVDRAGGKPLPGARVAWLAPEFNVHAQIASQSMVVDPGEVLRRGPMRLADAAGRVRVPRFPGSVILAGQQGDLTGWVELSHHPEGPFKLVLDRTRSVTVKVVDGSGRSVPGVPLRLDVQGKDGFRFPCGRGSTIGKEGVATIPLSTNERLREAQGPRYRIRFDFPLAVNKGVPVDPTGDPAHPVRLVLPPTGSLRILATDGEGRPYTRQAIAMVEAKGTVTSFAPLVDGRADFPFLGLNLAGGLYIHLYSLDQWTLPWQHHTCSGPAAPGQRVTARMVVKPHPTRLVGRILDDRDQPLANRMVGWHLDTAGWSSGGVVATDAKGAFTLRAKPHAEDRPIRLTLTLWKRTTRRGVPAGPGLHVQLPWPLPSGRVDLGDLRCRPGALLVGGRVVDNTGRPVTKASIFLRALLPGQDPRLKASWSCPPWDGPHLTDEKGRFAVRGHLAGKERLLKLHLRHSNYHTPEPLEVSAGARSLVVVLQRKGKGTLAGSLVLDSGVDPKTLRMVADRKGQGDPFRRIGWPAKDRTFRITGLQPGVYRLRIFLERSRAVLAEVDDVQVVAGQPSADSRLQSLSLQGRLRPVRLRVHLPQGMKKRRIWICEAQGPVVDGRHLGTSPWPDREGRLTLALSAGCRHLLVGARECRLERIEVIPGEMEIRLRPGLPVRLRVAPRPEGSFYLALVHRSGGADARSRGFREWAHPVQNQAVPAGGTKDLLLPGPGRYRLAWEALIVEGRRRGWVPVEESRPRVLTVKESPDRQRFEVALTAEDLAATRERFLAGRR